MYVNSREMNHGLQSAAVYFAIILCAPPSVHQTCKVISLKGNKHSVHSVLQIFPVPGYDTYFPHNKDS